MYYDGSWTVKAPGHPLIDRAARRHVRLLSSSETPNETERVLAGAGNDRHQ